MACAGRSWGAVCPGVCTSPRLGAPTTSGLENRHQSLHIELLSWGFGDGQSGAQDIFEEDRGGLGRRPPEEEKVIIQQCSWNGE